MRKPLFTDTDQDRQGTELSSKCWQCMNGIFSLLCQILSSLVCYLAPKWDSFDCSKCWELNKSTSISNSIKQQEWENREGCLLSMPVFTQYDTFQRGLGWGLLPTVMTILWRRHHVWTWITVVFWREHVFSLVYLLITKKTCILAVLSCSGNLSCGENLTFPLLWPKTESVQLSGLYQNSWLNLPRATFKPRHMMTHLIWDRGQKHSVPLTALSGKTRQAALRAPARALSCSDTCQWCILHKQPALWRTRAFWKVLNLDWSLCYTSSQHWGRRQIKVFSQNLVKGRGWLRTML